MSILYCAVACGHRVLCEQNVGKIDFSQQVRAHLDSSIQEFVTFALGIYTYNCFNRNGICFIAVTEAATSQQQTLNFLRQIESRYVSDPARVIEAQSGAEYCHQVDFGRILSDEMTNFASQDRTKLMQLQSQVGEVSILVHQNVTDLNERGAKLNELFEKTDQFGTDAQMFENTAKRVKEKAYWENCRTRLIIFSVIFAIVLTVLLIILWQSGVFE